MHVQARSDGETLSNSERASDLLSLVSPVVAGVLLQNPQRRAEDFAVPVPAKVLCADLTGFSVAGAALARSEARGAEELRDIVNAVFARVTAVIQLAGGQILQFSGDAVTAVWPGDGDPGAQILCAIAAGLDLQKACRDLAVPGMVALQMWETLAQGQIWIAHLTEGDASRETVICGDVFDAFRGQTGLRDGVLLASSLWAQGAAVVGARAAVVAETVGVRVISLVGAASTPAPEPTSTATDAAIIAGYVPGYLRDLLAGIATDWLAEFRSAQIVFARFAGFRFQGSDDLPRLAILSKGLRRAIDDNGGVRLKFGADDKGLILLAAWG